MIPQAKAKHSVSPSNSWQELYRIRNPDGGEEVAEAARAPKKRPPLGFS